jgi:predicted O-methyltransferase YrrM
MRQFTHDWLPESLSKRWREFVLPRLKHPLRWLELGSYEGRSACWVIDNVLEDEDVLVCVDHWVNADAEGRFDQNTAGRTEKVKSRTTQFLARAIAAGDSFDVVYIDADHEAKNVFKDAAMTWPLLPVGGIGIFDDYRWQMPAEKSHLLPPKPAIDAFIEVYAGYIDVLHKDYQVIFQKVGR